MEQVAHKLKLVKKTSQSTSVFAIVALRDNSLELSFSRPSFSRGRSVLQKILVSLSCWHLFPSMHNSCHVLLPGMRQSLPRVADGGLEESPRGGRPRYISSEVSLHPL